jgi:hypothetical protein
MWRSPRNLIETNPPVYSKKENDILKLKNEIKRLQCQADNYNRELLVERTLRMKFEEIILRTIESQKR